MANPDMLGAQFVNGGADVQFRVAAAAATRLELWIYAAATGAAAVFTGPMTLGSDGVYGLTMAVAGLRLNGTVYYGLRAWGSNWLYDAAWSPGRITGFACDVDRNGNRFNPNKLLLDPYALEVSHNPLTPDNPNESVYLSGTNFRTIDTGPFAPKGVVLGAPGGDFGTKPAGAFKDEIIYEVHLRGLTKNDGSVDPPLQGTYLGAAQRAAFLKGLGITAVEFQPIHETQNALNDNPDASYAHNYWGYDSCSFFAPDRRYASDQTPGGPTREWIQMVKAYHDAGLKVYVDMVYNHHNEGGVDVTGEIGAIYTLRGFNNTGYYEADDNPSQYVDNNGVGPNINAAVIAGQNLVMDSLQYWTQVMGADGFRFDLAAILGNSDASGGYDYDRDNPGNVLNRAVKELPVRPDAGGAGVDLIAEPYTADGNPDGQQQGNFPVGWSEWNDRYRDTVRAAQNKLGVVAITPGAMATRFAGSSDLFSARGRHPWNSVNYVVVHDGFTLRDLYSFNNTENDQPFPKGPSPGGRSAGDEMCWDQGGDPVLQRQADRTGLALLLLSAGVPLMTGGTEIYRTQFGNNNAFNLDTIANWLDWSQATSETVQTNYTRLLCQFRLAHPALRPFNFFTGNVNSGSGIKDITWYRDNGAEVDSGYFADSNNHFLAYRIDGSGMVNDPAASIYVAYNAYTAMITANLPEPGAGRSWYQVADTSASGGTGFGYIHPAGGEMKLDSLQYGVASRSVVVLIEK
jgi:glycogen operon protein